MVVASGREGVLWAVAQLSCCRHVSARLISPVTLDVTIFRPPPASHRALVSSQNWSEHPVLDLLTWIPLFLVASFPGRYSSTALRMKSMTTPSYLRWAAVSRLLKFCDAVHHMDCGLVRLYDRSTIPHGYMGSFVLSLLGCALCSAS